MNLTKLLKRGNNSFVVALLWGGGTTDVDTFSKFVGLTD